MLKKAIFKLFATLLILSAIGCQEESTYCPQKTPYLICIHEQTGEYTPDSAVIIIDGLIEHLTETGQLTDSVTDTAYAGAFPPDKIKIPLRVDYNTVSFRYIFDDSISDICQLYYKSNLLFESPNCGFISEFRIDDFLLETKNVFDSTLTISLDINDKQENNIKLFY